MNSPENNDLKVRAVFLTGLTDMGNELLSFHPNIQLGESINRDLCLKTMPMGCEDGDMLITRIGAYQAVSVTRIIPCFGKNSFKNDTFAALGLLIPKNTNPVPYYNLIKNLLGRFEKEGFLNKQTLCNMLPKLYSSINQKVGS